MQASNAIISVERAMSVAMSSLKSLTKATNLSSMFVYSHDLEGVNPNIDLQPGVTRKPDDTADQIREQQRLSTLSGGTEKIKNAMAATGVKDTSTMAIINHVLDMGKRLRKPVGGEPKMPEAELCAKLEKELDDLLREAPINPLIGMPGRLNSNDVCPRANRTR